MVYNCFNCVVLVNIFIAAWMQLSSAATTVPTTTLAPISYYLGETNITWHPDHNESLILTTDEGFKISVRVEYCKIDTLKNQFINITTGGKGEAIVLTGTIAANTKFLYNQNVLYLQFAGNKSSNVTLEFARIEDVITTTTTEQTTSTEYLPTPSINDTYQLVVSLSGLEAYKYRNPRILLDFKQMIANMAKEYCEDQGFELVDNITSNNVQIIGIFPCTTGWPSCNPCVVAKFAVPIHTKEDTEIWPGYQLNAEHLTLMWNRLSEKYLSEGITNCVLPDVDNWIKSRIILFVCVTVIFLIALLIMRHCSVKYTKAGIKNQTLQTGEANQPGEDDTEHDDPLAEHYYQEKPPFFDAGYTILESNSGLANPAFEMLPEPSSVLKKRRIITDDSQEQTRLEVNNDDNIGWNSFGIDNETTTV